MFFKITDRPGAVRLALTLLLPLLISMLSGCAQITRQADNLARAISAPDSQAPYLQGLANYRDSRYGPALANLESAVSSSDLTSDETVNAHKHIAFIHCVSNRETQCREQFQSILELDPGFALAPNESGHPLWGPVWQSVKGAFEDRRAIARGRGLFASAAQRKLAAGMGAYDAGRYNEAAEAFQAAFETGRLDRANRIRAHKYAAFTYCLTRQQSRCRTEFGAIFALDPAFELLPSEADHPAWKTAYRQELAAAKRSRSEGLAKE